MTPIPTLARWGGGLWACATVHDKHRQSAHRSAIDGLVPGRLAARSKYFEESLRQLLLGFTLSRFWAAGQGGCTRRLFRSRGAALLILLCLSDRQLDAKGGANPQFAAHADLATVLLDDAVGQG
jgi:hypothetical protein